MDNTSVYNWETSQGQITGFVLWVGIVEDIFDPLKLGRVRVRAIGFHNPDRVKMPTVTLPWATVIKSPTGSVGTSRLDIGDWVTGYFLDGIEAQRPTILGKYDGVYSQNPNRISEALLNPNTGNNIFKNTSLGITLTPEQEKMLRSYPKPAVTIRKQIYDRPTLALLAQGLVEGTAVGVANKNRAHVCDISAEMKKAAAYTRVAFGVLMQGIRKAVKAILALLGIKPDSESTRFIELARKIKKVIENAQRVVKTISDYATIVVYYAKQVRAMIDWILSLPKALAAMLAGCLNELLSSAAAGFSSLVAGSVGLDLGNSIKEITEIVDSSKKLITDTTNLLTVPGQVVEALATPSTAETQNQAINTLLTFSNSFSTSNNSLGKISRP